MLLQEAFVLQTHVDISLVCKTNTSRSAPNVFSVARNETGENCTTQEHFCHLIKGNQARAQTLASLHSQAPLFSGKSNHDSITLAAMSASRTIQPASCSHGIESLFLKGEFSDKELLFGVEAGMDPVEPVGRGCFVVRETPGQAAPIEREQHVLAKLLDSCILRIMFSIVSQPLECLALSCIVLHCLALCCTFALKQTTVFVGGLAWMNIGTHG